MLTNNTGLGLAQSDFGVRLGSMNIQEPHQGLANAYRKLGKIIQTVGDSQQAQATAEAFTIGDPSSPQLNSQGFSRSQLKMCS